MNRRCCLAVVIMLWAWTSTLRAQPFLERVGGNSYFPLNSTDFMAVHDTLLVEANNKFDSLICIRSTDGGATWNPSHLRIPGGEWLRATSNGTLLHFRTQSPAFIKYSTDGGWTWKDVALA